MAKDAALVGTGGAGQDLDCMGWDAGGIIEEGSAEVHEAELDIVRAAAELAGGGEQRQGEADVEYLWRCGTLRNTALATTPLLQRRGRPLQWQ